MTLQVRIEGHEGSSEEASSRPSSLGPLYHLGFDELLFQLIDVFLSFTVCCCISSKSYLCWSTCCCSHFFLASQIPIAGQIILKFNHASLQLLEIVVCCWSRDRACWSFYFIWGIKREVSMSSSDSMFLSLDIVRPLTSLRETRHGTISFL